MDHQWHAAPGPTQGNICPRCSTPHFPICPPNRSPRFSVVHNPLIVDEMHMQYHPPISSYTMVDPFHSPRYWERSPNNLNASHCQYQIQPPSVTDDPGNAIYARGGHLSQTVYRANAIGIGSDYGVMDRSSKRLKLDGTHLASYATEAYRNPSMALSNDDERRLKMIHDHCHGMNVLDYNTSLHETSADNLNYQANHHSGIYGYQNSPHYNGRANTLVENLSLGGYAQPRTIQHPDQTTYGCGPVRHLNDTRLFKESSTPTMEGYPVPGSYPKYSASSNYGNSQNGCLNPLTEEQPPLPSTLHSLPEAPPLDMPGKWTTQPNHSTDLARSSSLFPVDARSLLSANSLYPPVPKAHLLAPVYQQFSQTVHTPGSLFLKDSQGSQTAMSHYSGQGQHFFSENNVSDKQNIIDVVSLFVRPNRDRRPDHFVIILRGLPGSGKSYLARMIRDLEVEHGGKAPRIHSMDDYYMTEVDKVEENETSNSFVRGKKLVVKKVLEYCYEAEMDEAYRSSMLKAFKKTLDEGSFSIVIVDDRNLRVADFAQFWAAAKRSGYEVYLLETSYKDPAGCTARNIHGFTRDDIEKMVGLWEEAPSLYIQLDAKSLLHGDGSKESNIQEVDMDMDDEELFRGLSKLEERKQEDVTAKTSEGFGYDGSGDKKTWDAETDHPDEEIKDIRCSKWSGDLDEDNAEGSAGMKCKSTSLSGFYQAYGKEGKSVCWGDQIPNTGFSICAVKEANAASLIIGPGSGYNLKSNPLRAEEANLSSVKKNEQQKQKSVFQEHLLRVERESFKAVLDDRKKRLCISGRGLCFEEEEEDEDEDEDEEA